MAFYAYLYSDAGQTIWLYNHFPSTLSAFKSAEKGVFYTPKKLTLVSQLGGWSAVTNKFFAPSTGIVTQVESAHGYNS